MMGYSFEQSMSYFIRNIRLWDYYSKNPDDFCEKTEAEQKADNMREKLFSFITESAMKPESIKRLEERGLIRPQK